MSLEITRLPASHQFRICPTNPRVLERRVNKNGARWYWYCRRDTVNEAKATLLNLQGGANEQSDN